MRPLEDINRWKATEFRSFLLYVGHYALKGILPSAYYEHFLLLQSAVSILISPRLIIKNIDTAEMMLFEYVKGFKTLYGADSLVYNVHNMIHLANDARMYGPLDNFSAFPFENHIGHIKNVISSHKLPLQQLSNRIQESQTFNCTSETQKKTVFKAKKILNSEHVYEVCQKHNMTIRVDGKNDAVILKNGMIIVVVEYFHENECEFSGRKIEAWEDVFSSPLKSSSIGIKRANITEKIIITD